MDKKLFLLPLLSLLPLTLQAVDLRPSSGIYETSYGMLSARGERKLEALPDGRWKMENHAKLFMVDVVEKSTFMLDNGHVNSLTYDFVNPLSKDRSLSLSFDWPHNTVTELGRKATLKLEPNVYDKLSYQVQLQLDVCANPDQFPGENFTVVDRGKLKTYRVELVGREPQKTASGILNTVHLRQFRPDKRDGKDTMIWLAVDWNCLLVRLDQHEGDDIITLKLVKAKVGGVDVKDKP
ncbi:MAG TPA: DUF3108 domain-containing protein [Spongiibacteraceae bacterium]|nr:DUF3108 domain-containing protein [Spongiibacteraceae bacterium]